MNTAHDDILGQMGQMGQVFRTSHLGWIIQGESGESGTAHIQGYIWSKENGCENGKFRPFEKFPFKTMGSPWDAIHWEKRKGNHAQAFAYCHKVDSRIIPPMSSEPIPRDPQRITYDRLYPWQRKVADMFKEPADEFDRKIHLFVENNGKVGKSVLAKYFVDNMHALVVNGSSKDIFFGVGEYCKKCPTGPPIVIVCQAREQTHVAWGAIEQVKDGMFFSSKYESNMVRFNTPHVLFFGNSEPPFETMTEDRWVLHNMEDLLTEAYLWHGS